MVVRRVLYNYFIFVTDMKFKVQRYVLAVDVNVRRILYVLGYLVVVDVNVRRILYVLGYLFVDVNVLRIL